MNMSQKMSRWACHRRLGSDTAGTTCPLQPRAVIVSIVAIGHIVAIGPIVTIGPIVSIVSIVAIVATVSIVAIVALVTIVAIYIAVSTLIKQGPPVHSSRGLLYS